MVLVGHAPVKAIGSVKEGQVLVPSGQASQNSPGHASVGVRSCTHMRPLCYVFDLQNDGTAIATVDTSRSNVIAQALPRHAATHACTHARAHTRVRA